MRVAIHQPEYMGYMGFYNKMMNSDAWIFLDNVQLAKRDFMRRNQIRTPEGSKMLAVPIITKGRYYQLIHEVEIDNSQDWRKSHWMTITQNYRRAPHFKPYADYVAPIYQAEWSKLADLNITLIKTMAQLLGVERPCYKASELGVEGKSSQLLADLTKAVGGDVYLSGPMGRDYLEHDLFAERGLRLEFNDFKHPVYTQHPGGEFVPYMAAIDVLFNHGPEARAIIAHGSVLAAQAFAAERAQLAPVSAAASD